MKGVWYAAMQACIVGMTVGSLGPNMGAERSEQVAKERSWVFAARTRFSAMVWRLSAIGDDSAADIWGDKVASLGLCSESEVHYKQRIRWKPKKSFAYKDLTPGVC